MALLDTTVQTLALPRSQEAPRFGRVVRVHADFAMPCRTWDAATIMDAVALPGASPMVVAYMAAREVTPGHLLLYRVGEFYEVLLDDAATVSRILGIQLTRRRQKDAPDIPMCGIPASSAEAAIARLLTAGRKVAVSEQPTEPSGQRPLRLMTPGTSVDMDVLAPGTPNNLLIAHAEADKVGFAWIDLSTGEAATCVASLDSCAAALAFNALDVIAYQFVTTRKRIEASFAAVSNQTPSLILVKPIFM